MVNIPNRILFELYKYFYYYSCVTLHEAAKGLKRLQVLFSLSRQASRGVTEPFMVEFPTWSTLQRTWRQQSSHDLKSPRKRIYTTLYSPHVDLVHDCDLINESS